MNLYDDIISDVLQNLEELPQRSLTVSASSQWPDAGKAKMVLRSDMAYELGADLNYAVGTTITSTNASLIPDDEIVLIGPDINEISNDCSYARIALVRVNDQNMGEGNKLYNAIHSIEYFRYHIFPEGFMLRVSASNDRESVRVSCDAISGGLNFQKIGNFMLTALHKYRDVEAAKIIFVTDPNAPYKALQNDAIMTKKITETIDHMLKDVNMDCNTCSLQDVCDEVEGLKELHFGISQKAS